MRCRECGCKVGRKQQQCPACGSPMPKRRKWPWILSIFCVLVMATIAFFVVNYFRMRGTWDAWTGDDYAYEFSEMELSTVEASKSESVPSVAELADELKSRGFEEAQITAGYTMEGELLEDDALDAASKDKYPFYMVYYTTPQGNGWVVYSVNGELEANPLFAYTSLRGHVLLVESDHLVSYDSRSNTFSYTVPAEHEIELKKVGRIDAQTLADLDTVQKIEALP